MAKLAAESRLDSFFQSLSAELRNVHASPQVDQAVSRQLARMRKRARYVRPNLSSEAILRFCETNDLVKKKVLSPDSFVVNNARLFITRALERVTMMLDPDDVQGVLCLDYLFDNWRFGPGASFEVKGTHTAQKIEQDMTTTARAVPLVSSLRMRHPYLSLYDKTNGGGLRVVSGSKLTTVPKNEDVERTIAVEPSGNMALQLAAGMYLEEALRRVGLDIRTQQPKNKALACRGSLGGLATIDLKSASDMIKPELVRLLFPKIWYDLLMGLRSPCTRLPDGQWLSLNMISTMGNGYTFPLMTLIFVSLIYGLRCRKPGPTLHIDWNSTGVFGDDIIVPEHEYADLVDELEKWGFIVNTDKSFHVGPFRESCGGDYFGGYDVTPFYVKSLAKTSEIYVAINQLVTWCARHELALPHTLRYLVGLLPSRPFLVPEWHNPDQGILTSQGPRLYKYLARVPLKVKLRSDFFLTSLASGGFVESCGGANVFFTPRSDQPRMKVCTSRIPKGYVDGWDPLTRSHRESSWANLLVSLVT